VVTGGRGNQSENEERNKKKTEGKIDGNGGKPDDHIADDIEGKKLSKVKRKQDSCSRP